MLLKYPHLFQPLRIKNVTFKNRIFLSPTMMSELSKEGFPTHQTISYYEAKAKGGAALVTVGETAVDRDRAPTHPGHFNLFETAALPFLVQLVDAVHQHDCKISIELCHGGHESPPDVIGKNPFGPSAMVKADGTVVEEMTQADIDQVIASFASTAAFAERAGFDMVTLHGGHGWLLAQFTSPYANHRTDSYGGTPENRARFAKEVIAAIRKATGKDFLIEYRVSGSELTEGGLTLADTIEFLKQIEHDVDLIHVSAGLRANPHTRAIMHPSAFLEHGVNVYLAEAIKQEITACPIVTVGAITDPAKADKILEEGRADVVAMCRAAIADPDWPKKAKAGQEEQIRPCIKCFYCLDGEKIARRFGCSVNPSCGQNLRLDALTPAVPERKKRVVIVGGGPAGMEAAATAAERGHDVILLERSNRLGGQLKFGTHEYFKTGLRDFLHYLIRRVETSAVEVRLNTEATPELVESLRPDTVFAAVGASPVLPTIPGQDGPQVYSSLTYFEKLDQLGDRVVIIGGGLVGTEAALDLAVTHGKQVTIVEMLGQLAPDAWRTHRIPLLERVEEHVSVCLNAQCTNISESSVTYMDAAGSSIDIPADSVILAVGMRPNSETAESFRFTALDYVPIGDCVKIQNIFGAIHTGYYAALDL